MLVPFLMALTGLGMAAVVALCAILLGPCVRAAEPWSLDRRRASKRTPPPAPRMTPPHPSGGWLGRWWGS